MSNAPKTKLPLGEMFTEFVAGEPASNPPDSTEMLLAFTDALGRISGEVNTESWSEEDWSAFGKKFGFSEEAIDEAKESLAGWL